MSNPVLCGNSFQEVFYGDRESWVWWWWSITVVCFIHLLPFPEWSNIIRGVGYMDRYPPFLFCSWANTHFSKRGRPTRSLENSTRSRSRAPKRLAFVPNSVNSVLLSLPPRASDCFSCPPRNRGSRTHNNKIYEHFIAEEVVVESLGVKRGGGTKAGQIDLRGSERPKNNTVRKKNRPFFFINSFRPLPPSQKSVIWRKRQKCIKKKEAFAFDFGEIRAFCASLILTFTNTSSSSSSSSSCCSAVNLCPPSEQARGPHPKKTEAGDVNSPTTQKTFLSREGGSIFSPYRALMNNGFLWAENWNLA